MAEWAGMSPEERADWLNRASAAMNQISPEQRLSVAQANAALADSVQYERLMEHAAAEYVRATANMTSADAARYRGSFGIDWRSFYLYDGGIF
jgi:hypothetical protein